MSKNVRRAALTGGIIWSATLFLTTIANLLFGYGTDFLNIWVAIYPGFSISWTGSILGAVYGFFDMFVGVYLIAWVYDLVAKYW